MLTLLQRFINHVTKKSPIIQKPVFFTEDLTQAFKAIIKMQQQCEDCIAILNDHINKLRELNTKFNQRLSEYIEQEAENFYEREKQYILFIDKLAQKKHLIDNGLFLANNPDRDVNIKVFMEEVKELELGLKKLNESFIKSEFLILEEYKIASFSAVLLMEMKLRIDRIENFLTSSQPTILPLDLSQASSSLCVVTSQSDLLQSTALSQVVAPQLAISYCYPTVSSLQKTTIISSFSKKSINIVKSAPIAITGVRLSPSINQNSCSSSSSTNSVSLKIQSLETGITQECVTSKPTTISSELIAPEHEETLVIKGNAAVEISTNSSLLFTNKLPSKINPLDLRGDLTLLGENEIAEAVEFFSKYPNEFKFSKNNQQEDHKISRFSVIKAYNTFDPNEPEQLYALYGGKENQRLGKGSYGVVKLACCITGPNKGKWVAIKIQESIYSSFAHLKNEEHMLQKFSQYLGSQFRKNVPSRAKMGLVNKYYTVCLLAEGQTLEKFLIKNTDLSDQIKALIAVFKKLRLIHLVDRTLHGDLNFKNIIYDKNLRAVTFIDWYFAKELNEYGIAVSNSMFKNRNFNQYDLNQYHPPECYPGSSQSFPEGHVCIASDIYVLGFWIKYYFGDTFEDLTSKMLNYNIADRPVIEECIDYFENKLQLIMATIAARKANSYKVP